MADEQLPSSLQLSVLATLCYDQGHGALVASQVKPAHFDEVWRRFAGQVLQYRKRYNKAPGDNYLDDLFDQAATSNKNYANLKKQLLPELRAQAVGINGEYITTRVQDFVRRQVLKAAVIQAGDRYSQDDEKLVEDVEKIFHDALKYRQETMDAGTFLNDIKALRFLNRNTDDFISLGIPVLDQLRVGLYPKQLLLYIAPKGSGKSWFCVHCGRQALLQRQKVVHYSLEMSEEQVLPRYYQNLFSVAVNDERYTRSLLEFDDLHRLTGFSTKNVKPKLDMGQSGIRKILASKMKHIGARFGGLVIKAFATSEATVDTIASHLDYLEEVEKFIPNGIIVDYPDLMETGAKNYRIEIGQHFEQLRGLGVKRNLWVVAPTQGQRATIGAKRVRAANVAEDIRKVNAADTVFAYSCTEAEERLNLGRLSLEFTRAAKSKSLILLSQSYATGQYVLDSALMQQAYWDALKEHGGEDDE